MTTRPPRSAWRSTKSTPRRWFLVVPILSWG